MIVRGNIGGGDLRGFGLDQDYSKLGYGTSFGVLGCTSLDHAITNINNSIGAADAAGVPNTDPDYAAARAYLDAAPWVVWSMDTCDADTAQANALYSALTAKISAAGGTPPAPITPDGGGSSFLSSLNPFAGGSGIPGWAIGIIVVAGILGLGWLVSSGSKIYLASKKAKSLAS